MSENEFLNALKEEMPDDFGRDLLKQLKAEEKSKVKPLPSTVWTVAAACLVTVLVGFVLFISRMPQGSPMSVARELWQMRDPITPENIQLAEPLLTIGYGHAEAIALSPDNNILAVATTIGIYLHYAHNLEAAPRFLGVPEDVQVDTPFLNNFVYMEFSEDGRLFVFIKGVNEINLYQWDESQNFSKLFTHRAVGISPQVVDISPDGTKLLLGACSNSSGTIGSYCPSQSLARIQITELATGENLFYRSPRNMDNAVVAVSPDWTRLIFQEEDQIKLLDLASGEMQTLLIMDAAENTEAIAWNELHTLYFSPDGTKLGINDSLSGETIAWWDISQLQASAEHVPAFGEYSEIYYNRRPIAAINPLGGEYIVASDAGILRYDYFDPRPTLRLESVAKPMSYLMSSDGQSLYTLDDTGVIRIWDMRSESLSVTSTRYGIGAYLDFTISADSSTFIRGSDSYYQGLGYLFEITNSGIEQQPLSSGANGYLTTMNTAISMDSRYIAFTENEQLWVYDSHEGRYLQMDSSVFTPVLAFRPDGALLSFDRLPNNELRANLYTPEMIQSGDIPANTAIEPAQEFPVSTFSFSPDGTKLALMYCINYMSFIAPLCGDVGLHVFDTSSWEEIGEFASGIGRIGLFSGINFSSDSNWLLLSYCTDRASSGWECEEGSNVAEIFNLQQLSQTVEPTLTLDSLPFEFWGGALFGISNYSDGSFIITSLSYDVDETSSTMAPFTTFWHVQADGSYEEVLRLQRSSITMSPDNSYFLTARNGQIELWGVPASITRGD